MKGLLNIVYNVKGLLNIVYDVKGLLNIVYDVKGLLWTLSTVFTYSPENSATQKLSFIVILLLFM